MDTLEVIREIIQTSLLEYARIPYAYGDIQTETVFDLANDHYLLINVGWDQGKRVHGALIHIDIIDDKVWIQRDGTEQGIASDLLQAGIPKERIVLAFKPPSMRKRTEFAVA